jgi:hypothetical protein
MRFGSDDEASAVGYLSIDERMESLRGCMNSVACGVVSYLVSRGDFGASVNFIDLRRPRSWCAGRREIGLVVGSPYSELPKSD